MFQRIIPSVLVALCVGGLGLGNAEAAKYRYGNYQTGASGSQGFFIQIEGGLANPRNTDTIFATVENFGATNTVQQLFPGWDAEVSGRFALGYRWANGNRLEARAWGFTAETADTFTGDPGGVMHFAVGPPVCVSSGSGGCTDYEADSASPGFVSLTNEITATAGDILFAREEELGDSFSLEWAVGARFASFEETFTGTQGQNIASTAGSYNVDKSNEATYYGARAAVRGTYSLTPSFYAGAGLGFSFLDGEIDAVASLTPRTGGTGSRITAFDDGRSGNILEFDVRAGWRSPGGTWNIWVGWEQSSWSGLTRDLVRNSPGTAYPLPERDEIVFSALVLGAGVQF